MARRTQPLHFTPGRCLDEQPVRLGVTLLPRYQQFRPWGSRLLMKDLSLRLEFVVDDTGVASFCAVLVVYHRQGVCDHSLSFHHHQKHMSLSSSFHRHCIRHHSLRFRSTFESEPRSGVTAKLSCNGVRKMRLVWRWFVGARPSQDRRWTSWQHTSASSPN